MNTNDSRLTVLHVLHGLTVGGAEALVDRLIRNLSDEFQFAVACLDTVGSIGEQLQLAGIPIVNLERRPGVDRQCASRLARFASELNVDLLHAHQYTPFFYSVVSRGFRGRTPVLFTEHGRHYPDVRKRKRVFFNRMLARRSDQVVGVGQAVKQALIKNEGFPAQRVKVIYNGVETKPILATPPDRLGVRREFNIPRDGKIVIQVARLDYLKDHTTAARAFRKLVDDIKDAYWLIVGGGPEIDAIKATINKLGLNEFARFSGERSDVPRLLKASDLMLLSSISEGIPLTLIEGMLARLPLVSTNVGGVPEIIREGEDGFLVPPGTPDAMAAALSRLLTDESQRDRMGQAGLLRATAEFNETRMHEEYSSLYAALPHLS